MGLRDMVAAASGWLHARRDTAVHNKLGFMASLFDPMKEMLAEHMAAAEARKREHEAAAAVHTAQAQAHQTAIDQSAMLAANVEKLFTQPL
jgi:hypothetical protein